MKKQYVKIVEDSIKQLATDEDNITSYVSRYIIPNPNDFLTFLKSILSNSQISDSSQDLIVANVKRELDKYKNATTRSYQFGRNI